MLRTIILLVLCTGAAISSEVQKEIQRRGKIFLVTTTTSTSILSSVTFCWVSSETLVGQCRRKRRAREQFGVTKTEEEIQPAPSIRREADPLGMIHGNIRLGLGRNWLNP